MTKFEAMDVYIEALNRRDRTPESKARVVGALNALKQFKKDRRLPDELHQYAKGKIKGQPQ